jgi:hypothetical protein
MGFEHAIPESELAKTFYVLYSAATVIGEIIFKLELQTQQS